jgi:hypothetical protein
MPTRRISPAEIKIPGEESAALYIASKLPDTRKLNFYIYRCRYERKGPPRSARGSLPGKLPLPTFASLFGRAASTCRCFLRALNVSQRAKSFFLLPTNLNAPELDHGFTELDSFMVDSNDDRCSTPTLLEFKNRRSCST